MGLCIAGAVMMFAEDAKCLAQESLSNHSAPKTKIFREPLKIEAQPAIKLEDGRYAVSGPVAETEREKVLGDAVYKIEGEVIAPASLIHEKVIAGERTIKEEEEAYRKVVNTIADFLKEEKYNDMTPGEHRICSDLRRDLSFYVKRLALLEEGNLYQPFEIENFKKARQAYLESL